MNALVVHARVEALLDLALLVLAQARVAKQDVHFSYKPRRSTINC